MNDEADNQGPQPTPPGVDAWDRLGQLMSQMNETGQSIAQRHLEVWTKISESLRDPNYGADHWARNNVRVAESMFQDMQTLMGLWTAPSDRRPAAGPIPTILLYVEVDKERVVGKDSVPNPEYIAVPESATGDVHIWLSGGASWPVIRNAITVERDATDKGKYKVSYKRPDPDALVEAGSYSGLIYLRTDRSVVALADLRVLVQSPDTTDI